MEFEPRVVSTNPIAALYLGRVLSKDQTLRLRNCAKPRSSFEWADQGSKPCVFLLDTSALPLELSALCRVLRVRHPLSKFLALLPAERSTDDEILRFLYLGIDGTVGITDGFEHELLRAVHAVMSGSFWIPRHVMREYVRQTNLLLEIQVLSDHSLTARENQIFQFMIRRLSNKEIGGLLGISDRTVKFHVSNVFAKFKIQSRRELWSNLNIPAQSKAQAPKTKESDVFPSEFLQTKMTKGGDWNLIRWLKLNRPALT